MSRSLKKGPYVDEKLVLKVQKYKDEGSKKPVKTWKRSCTIIPEFIDVKFLVHNGRSHVLVHIMEDMVGYKLGDFAPTRKFMGHAAKGKIAKATGQTGSK